MSYLVFSLKAARLRKKCLRYEQEKMNSIRIHKGEKPVYTIADRYRHCCSIIKRFVKKWCLCTVWCQPGTRCGNYLQKLLFYGTLENYVMTSCLGFFGGMLLTYILFMFFVFQLHFATKSATIWCAIIGTVLTLGLAFSYYVRCIVVFVLPQLCVNRGRQALMLCAFVLALTGPGKNTMQNIGILAESLSCGQEQLKIAAQKVMEAIKKPFLAMKDALMNAMKTIKSIMLKIKDTLLSIKRVVMSICKLRKELLCCN